jgi:hypothetical protein
MGLIRISGASINRRNRCVLLAIHHSPQHQTQW